MDAALTRCLEAVPPTSLDEMKHPSKTVALLCTLSGCASCEDFVADGQRAYEERMRGAHPDLVIRPWNCDIHQLRSLARSAGVTDLPAYVVLSPDGHISVQCAV